MEQLEGKTAFITGAASGIGYGMAEAFVDAGMRVVVTDVEQAALDAAARALGRRGEVLTLHLDVTDRAAFAAAADAAEANFGPVHLLCLNAGVTARGPMDRATYADWDWVLGVNLGGVVNGLVTFLPRMRDHGEGGHIVNTASAAGLLAHAGNGPYSATKFAVVGISEALAAEVGRYGIGVSVLCPGAVLTGINEAERNRPTHLAGTGNPVPPEQKALLDKSFEGGSTPREIGDYVLAAVKRGDHYILPHREFLPAFQAKVERITAAFNPEEPPEARLAGGKVRQEAFALFWED